MNKIFRPRVLSFSLLVAVLNLTGCGLKGPLYFPPADKTAAPPPTQPVEQTIQSDAPDRNDRGLGDGPTQVGY